MDEVAPPLGPTLKHVQVREYVRGLVHDLPEGAPAPSERGLMQQFGVARMTVRQAIDALVSEGLLERAPARGTFVCKAPRPVSRRRPAASNRRHLASRPRRPNRQRLASRRG